MPEPLLDVRDLETRFFLRKGVLTAVDRVSFRLEERQTLGIVGETGSGKSVLALSLMRLVPQPPGRITRGQVLFEGEDLLAKTEQEMRSYRGSRISMIFQEPMVALNPAYTVGDQVARVTEPAPAMTEMRAPYTTREKMSRPKVSVPKGWSAESGASRAVRSTSSGS